MNPITVPMMVKGHQPFLAAILLVLIAAAFLGVCFLMARHQHRARRRKRHGHNNHTGHHGNH